MNAHSAKSLRAAWRDAVVLLAYCGLIFFLSSRSTLPVSEDLFANEDKLFHAGGYAIMAWFAWRTFTHRLGSSSSVAAAAFLFSSIYGISDEWHQSFVPQRDPDIWDWVADSTGSLCAVVTLYCWNRDSSTRKRAR